MRVLLIAMVVLITSGCSSFSPIKSSKLVRNGINPKLDAKKIDTFRENQDLVLESLKKLTDDESDLANEWQKYTRTGFMIVDSECHEYMTLLYRLDQSKSEVESQLNLFNTTTATVQGLLEETAKTISITGAGLGLLEGAWRNYGSSLLFELEPEAVNELVDKMQDVYNAEFKYSNVLSRSQAFSAIYKYAELCTPVKISREVSNAINAADAEATQTADGANKILSITVNPKRKRTR